MRCDWIAPESDRWLDFLSANPHDFYHLPEYVRMAARVEGGTAGAMIVGDARGAFLVPLILRPIEAGRVDAISPYGYPTPLWSQGADETFVRAALQAFMAALRDLQVVSAFVRLHPLLTIHLDLLSSHGQVVAGGETVVINLRSTAEEMWRATRENHRRTIRRAEKSGFVARVDGSWERLAGFVDAYTQTMRRVEATGYYFFSDQYYTDLRHALGERIHLLLVEHSGDVAAAALFTECSGIVQYHLGGTDDRFLAAAPMKLLFHFARTWFAARGNALMHLGGGLGSREDSLFHFKAGFSDDRARFHSWRLVPLPDAYDDLVQQWTRRSARAPTGAFFPAYREPI